MGCFDFCAEFHENYIRHNRPVQLALAVVFGILFITIILAIGGAFKSSPCPSCTSCMYYQFTQNSLQTTCKLEAKDKATCIDKLPSSLTIHGVWPQLTQKKPYLSNCEDNKDKFDFNVLSAKAKTEIKDRWPTAFKTNASGSVVTDNEFWTHEFNKHGTCSLLKAKDYFEKALDLDAKYPVATWLAASYIKPNNSRPYTVDEFKSALTKHIHQSQYTLSCVQIEEKSWLKEVSLCVSFADMSTLISCPVIEENRCKAPFYYMATYK